MGRELLEQNVRERMKKKKERGIFGELCPRGTSNQVVSTPEVASRPGANSALLAQCAEIGCGTPLGKVGVCWMVGKQRRLRGIYPMTNLPAQDIPQVL